MNSDCNFNNSEYWQDLSEDQQELIQGSGSDTHSIDDVQFSYDKIDISIIGKSSPGGVGNNQIRWDDRPGNNK
ncbi:MAG: hypothetical protein HC903_05315 [Methylacidiphilales bacterium]|nr:hypothetical protein [Candidatus Methylacidiphilales bacterium]